MDAITEILSFSLSYFEIVSKSWIQVHAKRESEQEIV